jgi:RNA polymerase sigma factor (sigma-70 family)
MTAPDHELAATVRAAAARDAAAFRCLVERYDRSLRAVTRFYRLDRWDADDVVQATWLQFLEHGGDLREPAAIGGWLTTTTRRQCLRTLQRRMRELPSDDPALGDDPHHPDPHHALVAGERRTALLAALERLPVRNRRLMTLLVAKPDLSYEEVGRALDMPIGSIGPTRLRSIGRLQRDGDLRPLRGEG